MIEWQSNSIQSVCLLWAGIFTLQSWKLNNPTLELLHCHVICQLKNLTSNFLRQEVTMALNSKTISSTFEMDQIHDIN